MNGQAAWDAERQRVKQNLEDCADKSRVKPDTDADEIHLGALFTGNRDIVCEHVPTEVVPGTTPLPIYPSTAAFMSGGSTHLPAVAAEPSGLDARTRCGGSNSEETP